MVLEAQVNNINIRGGYLSDNEKRDSLAYYEVERFFTSNTNLKDLIKEHILRNNLIQEVLTATQVDSYNKNNSI